jgi:hypothetical protein
MAQTLTLFDARSQLKDLDARHGEYQDSMVAEFERRLDVIVENAATQVFDALSKQLAIDKDKGTVAGSLANRGKLADVDALFEKAMKDAGYDKLTLAFVSQFPGQLPLLNKTLATISRAMGSAISAGAALSPADLEQLANSQRLTLESLRSTVAEVARLAKQRALAKYNGLRPSQLERLLEKTFENTSGQARTLAATGMAIWYRQATALALKKVEKETPLEYSYDGPDDRLTRDFCHTLKRDQANGKTWTKKQIDAMDNGQLPNVFESGGGFNCRHQWRVALTEDHKTAVDRNTRIAAGGLLTPGEVVKFTRQSVIKGTYSHRTATAEAAAKLRSNGIDFGFAPANAPFGAGFYASTPGASRAASVDVAFNLQRPLAGSWSEVKDKVAAIAEPFASDTAKVRAMEIRRALMAQGYDGIVATRPNGQRLIIAIKKGSAALVEPYTR